MTPVIHYTMGGVAVDTSGTYLYEFDSKLMMIDYVQEFYRFDHNINNNNNNNNNNQIICHE